MGVMKPWSSAFSSTGLGCFLNHTLIAIYPHKVPSRGSFDLCFWRHRTKPKNPQPVGIPRSSPVLLISPFAGGRAP
jgi:hypothetical protein